MLSFDLAEIAAHAVQVDGTLAPDDPVWEEGDPKPVAPIRVTGRLSSAGTHDRFYWQGHIDGQVALECRRCLTDLTEEVHETVHLLFAGPGDEEAADDPDVYPIDLQRDELDLRPAVREQWLLAVPTFVVCSDECKGICPSCGADLNEGPCTCAPKTDSRWDALRGPTPGEPR